MCVWCLKYLDNDYRPYFGVSGFKNDFFLVKEDRALKKRVMFKVLAVYHLGIVSHAMATAPGALSDVLKEALSQSFCKQGWPTSQKHLIEFWSSFTSM